MTKEHLSTGRIDECTYLFLSKLDFFLCKWGQVYTWPFISDISS